MFLLLFYCAQNYIGKNVLEKKTEKKIEKKGKTPANPPVFSSLGLFPPTLAQQPAAELGSSPAPHFSPSPSVADVWAPPFLSLAPRAHVAASCSSPPHRQRAGHDREANPPGFFGISLLFSQTERYKAFSLNPATSFHHLLHPGNPSRPQREVLDLAEQSFIRRRGTPSLLLLDAS